MLSPFSTDNTVSRAMRDLEARHRAIFGEADRDPLPTLDDIAELLRPRRQPDIVVNIIINQEANNDDL